MRESKSVFYKPMGGSAPLSIYYFDSGNLGDATEANNELGVGWFSPNGEILAVQFDDVDEKQDHQELKFDRYKVEVTVKNGKISHSLTELNAPKKSPKSSKRRDEDAA